MKTMKTMKTFLKPFFTLCAVAMIVMACTPPPPGLEVFNYAENNSPTMILLNAPDAYSNAKKIAGKSTTSTAVIDIKLNSLAVGTYTIGSSTGNEFVYKKPGVTNVWKGVSGTVTITTNSGGLIYGTFNITSGSGIPSVNLMKGNFSDVVIEP